MVGVEPLLLRCRHYSHRLDEGCLNINAAADFWTADLRLPPCCSEILLAEREGRGEGRGEGAEGRADPLSR